MNENQTIQAVVEAALQNATVDQLSLLSNEEKKALLIRLRNEQSAPTVPWTERVRNLFLALSTEEENAQKTDDYVRLKDKTRIR